jgi:hypothetical protein
MKISSFGKPFHAGKEMHVLTLEALIGACSKLESFVVDYITLTGMYCSQHFIVALYFHFKTSFNIIFLLGNNVLACRNLNRHILALDGN